MTDEKRFHRRANVLLLIFTLCLIFFVGILYSAQIVNGSEYLARSTTQVTTSQTVKSSRGIITDRNGKVLVSNQEIYTISFDPDQVPSDEGVPRQESVARAVLRLIQLCQESGVEWDDGLPVSAQAPFSYTFSTASGTQRARLQNFLADRGWSNSELTAASAFPLMSGKLLQEMGLETSAALSASHLMELMRANFGIPVDFTSQEARLVLGVLYELALRSLDGQRATTVPYVFTEDVSVELISILNDGHFAGAVVGSRAVRQYNTDYAAHILGRIGKFESRDERDALNEPYYAAREAGEDTSPYHYYQLDDQVGRSGVERAFESYLRGKDGTRLITTNQEGKITSELYSIEPEPGGAVALTIDIDFQAAVEEALARSVEAMAAEDGIEDRGAAAAVVSVADSEILALGTYPSYSQRTYVEDYAALSEDPRHPFVNRAISSAYAPGSTFKPLTAIAGLESGVITPSTIINTLGRYMYYYDPNPARSYTPSCWLYRQSGGRHGRINVTQAIYHSCNYFFYEIGRLTGIDTLDEYATAFGLGEHTGIELGESTGTLAGPAYSQSQGQTWYGGNTLQAAIGQSDNTFTPLQLANYIATFLRGGVRLDAHLLKEVDAYDGSGVLYSHQPEILSEIAVDGANIAAVKQGMGDLVSKGSVSRQFASCVVSAGAKTGSAQTGDTNANGVFVCFAPFDEPEIAVAVVIEKGKAGSALASTAVEILNAYFAPSDIGMMMTPEGVLLP